VKCHGLIPFECLDHLVYRGSKGKDMEFQIEQAKDCVTWIKNLLCSTSTNTLRYGTKCWVRYRHYAQNEEKMLIHMLNGGNIHTCSNSTLIHGYHTQLMITAGQQTISIVLYVW